MNKTTYRITKRGELAVGLAIVTAAMLVMYSGYALALMLTLVYGAVTLAVVQER